MENNADFYIGWQDKASPTFARPVRRVAIGLFVLIPIMAVLLVVQQRGFSDAMFEYGTLTTIEGELIREPVPFLRVPAKGSSASKPLFERLLLIGLGKHGADSTLANWERSHGTLAGKTLKIRGTLIYHEGKAALELTEEADALLSVTKPVTPTVPTVVQSLGSVSMQGEITDPKCFLGVMKPGDGRPHRSCAIRCIAGGIPPLLYVNNGHGQRNGYVLVGAQGEPINDQVLGYVGKGVQVRGRLEQVDNWFILYIDKPIVATRLLPGLGEPIAMCH
jgi:hypothetical protein